MREEISYVEEGGYLGTSPTMCRDQEAQEAGAQPHIPTSYTARISAHTIRSRPLVVSAPFFPLLAKPNVYDEYRPI